MPLDEQIEEGALVPVSYDPFSYLMYCCQGRINIRQPKIDALWQTFDAANLPAERGMRDPGRLLRPLQKELEVYFAGMIPPANVKLQIGLYCARDFMQCFLNVNDDTPSAYHLRVNGVTVNNFELEKQRVKNVIRQFSLYAIETGIENRPMPPDLATITSDAAWRYCEMLVTEYKVAIRGLGEEPSKWMRGFPLDNFDIGDISLQENPMASPRAGLDDDHHFDNASADVLNNALKAFLDTPKGHDLIRAAARQISRQKKSDIAGTGPLLAAILPGLNARGLTTTRQRVGDTKTFRAISKTIGTARKGRNEKE